MTHSRLWHTYVPDPGMGGGGSYKLTYVPDIVAVLKPFPHPLPELVRGL